MRANDSGACSEYLGSSLLSLWRRPARAQPLLTTEFGDGMKGSPTIPLALNLAGVLVFCRSRATLSFVAEFVCDIDENTLRRFAVQYAAFVEDGGLYEKWVH